METRSLSLSDGRNLDFRRDGSIAGKATFAGIFGRERVHILVNNAGVSHIGTVESTIEADFDRLVRVHVTRFYKCMHIIVPTCAITTEKSSLTIVT